MLLVNILNENHFYCLNLLYFNHFYCWGIWIWPGFDQTKNNKYDYQPLNWLTYCCPTLRSPYLVLSGDISPGCEAEVWRKWGVHCVSLCPELRLPTTLLTTMGICSTANCEPRPSSFSNKPEYILQFNECKLFTAAFMSINIFYRDSILYFYHRGGTGVSLMLLSPLH